MIMWFLFQRDHGPRCGFVIAVLISMNASRAVSLRSDGGCNAGAGSVLYMCFGMCLCGDGEKACRMLTCVDVNCTNFLIGSIHLHNRWSFFMLSDGFINGRLFLQTRIPYC